VKYDLVNVGGIGYLWIVQSKRRAPPRTYGQLRFEDRRLIMVTRDWGPENQQRGFDLARRLYLALAELTKEGSEGCQIKLKDYEETSHDAKYIYFRCGEKYVAVAITKEGGNNLPTGEREFAHIDEVLLIQELRDQHFRDQR
jgi:hypothetical protein